MSKVIYINNENKIGLSTRRPTNGSEWALVQDFTEYFTSLYRKSRKRSSSLAVFYEPSLETGFPDLVFAEYKPKVFDRWVDGRLNLQLSDIKVLQHIYHSNGVTSKDIEKQIGMDTRTLLNTIERLLDAHVVKRDFGYWMAVDIDEIFGVEKLIAIEAKVKHNVTVFQQAQLNRWFASESYALFPVTKTTAKAVERSEEYGVGVYVFNTDKGFSELMPSPKQKLPSCYGSWLFNEWVGRSISRNLECQGDGVIDNNITT